MIRRLSPDRRRRRPVLPRAGAGCGTWIAVCSPCSRDRAEWWPVDRPWQPGSRPRTWSGSCGATSSRRSTRGHVDHTGEPSWDQRAWAAVLWGWPSALSHSSALAVVEGPGSPHRSGVIEIAVVKDRRLLDRPGVVVRRSAHVAARTHVAAPPRVRYDDAALDVVARLDRGDDVVAEVGRVVQVRCTSPERLLSAVRSRRRVRHRDLLVDLLGDLAAGATSALERRYLCDVERAHGLPQAIRQLRHRTRDGVVYRDVLYVLAGRLLVLELDRSGSSTSRPGNGTVTSNETCWPGSSTERRRRGSGGASAPAGRAGPLGW